jgi:probable F420-dependent oxidoreductase
MGAEPLKASLIYSPRDTLGPVEFAQLGEEKGFYAVFFPEHSHIPVDRSTPYPAVDRSTSSPALDGRLGPLYSEFYDSAVCLGAVATNTKTIRMGTGLAVMTERHPISTAKEFATIDHLSGGRTVFGVGAGWNEEEMRNHGVDPPSRWRVMRESVEVMREIWGADEPEYHGAFFDFDPIWCGPKPLQKFPPIFVGGEGAKVHDRVLAYGDGWSAEHTFNTPEKLVERIADLQRRGREEKGLESVPVTIHSAPLEYETLLAYAEAGATNVAIGSVADPFAEPEMERLDEVIHLVRRVNTTLSRRAETESAVVDGGHS